MLGMTKDAEMEGFLDVLLWRSPHHHPICSLGDVHHQHGKLFLDGVLAFEAKDRTWECP
jgi:hypothetical protein